MPKVVIKDVPGLDGEYELDLTFTHRDFRTIKQIAGVRANEVMDSINAGDLDIIVALAEIAIQRSGKPHSVDQLWDAEAGSITLDVSADEMEEDTLPPPSEPVDEPRTSDEPVSSGIATNGSTEHSPETVTLDSSGTPLRGATYGPPTSTT